MIAKGGRAGNSATMTDQWPVSSKAAMAASRSGKPRASAYPKAVPRQFRRLSLQEARSFGPSASRRAATAGPSQPTRTWLTILWELPEGDRVVLSLGEDPLNPIAAGDQGVAAAIPDDDPIDEEDGRQEQAEADNRVLIHLAGGAELREKYGE